MSTHAMHEKVRAAFKKGPLSGMAASIEAKGTKGALHEQLGIAKDKKIPTSTLREHEHAKGLLGQRARAALRFRGK